MNIKKGSRLFIAALLFPILSYFFFGFNIQRAQAETMPLNGLYETWYNSVRLDKNDRSIPDVVFGYSHNVTEGNAKDPEDNIAGFAKEETRKAYDTFDKSVVFKEPGIYQGKYGWINSLDWDDEWYSKYIWGEFTGYIKFPVGETLFHGTLDSRSRLIVEIDGKRVVDKWDSIPNTKEALEGNPYDSSIRNTYLSKIKVEEEGALIRIQNEPGNQYKQIRILIGRTGERIPEDYYYCKEAVSIGYFGLAELWAYKSFPISSFYTTIPAKDLGPYLKLDDEKDDVRFTGVARTLDLSRYQYGFGQLTPSGQLQMPQEFYDFDFYNQYVGDVAGILMIKDKGSNSQAEMLQAGEFTKGLTAPKDLAITCRGIAENTLEWTAAKTSSAIKEYQIYRRTIRDTEGFIQINPASEKIGVTTATRYTDEALEVNYIQEGIYEYTVKAVDKKGNISEESNPVRTDKVPITNPPTTPTGLELVAKGPDEVNLKWKASSDSSGIEKYVVLRQMTWQENGTGRLELLPKLIGSSTKTEYKDTSYEDGPYKDHSLEMGQAYKYWVIAVDSDKNPSVRSNAVTVRVPTAPLAPTELKAGSIYQPEGKVEFFIPPSKREGVVNAAYSVFLGPQKEAYLEWKPSEGEYKVVGYDIYREGRGLNYSERAESLAWLEDKHKVATTRDTFFTDSGLNPGGSYTYTVVARGEEDCGFPGEQVRVHTICPYLHDLTLSSGTLEPSFSYHHQEYTAQVEYAVETITLKPIHIDDCSTVMVNGKEVLPGRVSEPVRLDLGPNTINVDVLSRKTDNPYMEKQVRYTITVNRGNMKNPPKLTLPQEVTVLDEGDTYRAEGLLAVTEETQAISKGKWQGLVDYGDSTGLQKLSLNSDGTFQLQHQYKDDGDYEVAVTFIYQGVGEVTGYTPVKVHNVAPELSGPGMVDEIEALEGETVSLDGMVVDPGDDIWVLTVDYDNALGPLTVPLNPDKTFTLKHKFYDSRPFYDISIKVADDEGAFAKRDIKVNVNNVIPAVEIGSDAVAQKGVAFTRAGQFSDPGLDTWKAYVNYGDGRGEQELSLSEGKTFNLRHVYPTKGSYTVTVRVEDNDGGEGRASFAVKVKDYVISPKAGDDASLDEGQNLQRTVQINGPGDKIDSVTVDYGDDSGEKTLPLLERKISVGMTDAVDRRDAGGASGIGGNQTDAITMKTGAVQLGHVYSDDGSYTVSVKVRDVDGDCYEDSFHVDVANVAPEVKINSSGNIREGETFICSGSFNDPGADEWTATVDFGDGRGEIPLDLSGDKTFSVGHCYNSFGNYTVSVKVRDKDGGEGGDTVLLWVQSRGGGASGNADLSSLVLHNRPLVPDFSADCLDYTVNYGDDSITVTATASDSEASIAAYNWGSDTWVSMTSGESQGVSFGGASAPEDSAKMLIRVTAANGATKTYTVTKS